ncbi:MAG TPA: hypothetical protein VF234_03595, partial [Limnochordia bacterium]
DKNRWDRHAVDALGRVIVRISDEVRDPRSTRIGVHESGAGELLGDVLYLNMSMIGASEIINGTAHEAWIRFDLRSPNEKRLFDAHEQIRKITEEVLKEMGPGYSYVYEINSENGTEHGIPGWDATDNAPARLAAAAAQALYGTDPVIDPTRGCGDCVRAYRSGMPALSLRGNVIDYGEGGRFEVRRGSPLASEVRRKSASHDVTESVEIARIWSGVKHGLVFAVSYAGLGH